MEELAKEVKDYWQIGVMIFIFAGIYYKLNANTLSVKDIKTELLKISEFMYKSEVRLDTCESNLENHQQRCREDKRLMDRKIDGKEDKA